MRKKANKSKDPLICYCNRVRKSSIEKAIRAGADSLAKIYDSTDAGVGGCGGSCRPKLKILLKEFDPNDN